MSASAVYTTTGAETIQILGDHHHQQQQHQQQLVDGTTTVAATTIVDPSQMAAIGPILVPSGAATVQTTPIAVIAPNTTADYSTMNGGVMTVNDEFYQQQQQAHSTEIVHNAGEVAGVPVGANSGTTTAPSSASANEGNPIPLDQLKQMLSTQLDYYFSR